MKKLREELISAKRKPWGDGGLLNRSNELGRSPRSVVPRLIYIAAYQE